MRSKPSVDLATWRAEWIRSLRPKELREILRSLAGKPGLCLLRDAGGPNSTGTPFIPVPIVRIVEIEPAAGEIRIICPCWTRRSFLDPRPPIELHLRVQPWPLSTGAHWVGIHQCPECLTVYWWMRFEIGRDV